MKWEERDREAQNLHDPKSSSPPEPAAPFYRRLVYEILLGEPDRQEAEGVEEEQKAVPEPEDLQNPEDPSAPEDRKSPADIEYKTPAREEAEEQGQAPGRGTNHPSRRSPQRRGRVVPQTPVTEVQSRRPGAQPGRPGPAAPSQLTGRRNPWPGMKKLPFPLGKKTPSHKLRPASKRRRPRGPPPRVTGGAQGKSP